MKQNSDGSFFQYCYRLISESLHLKVTPERFDVVCKIVADGSQPEARFYIMVVVSTLIAGFGLISNSTAVVIGAMLVAPLMSPIFGISLAVVREDAHLLNRSLQAEFIGMVAAVGMGVVVGWLALKVDPYLKVTEQMLSRTHPNLSDLAVAVLAGFGGAYALIDEKISPILPGVAIATAIVPPLANSGLCFAYGAYSGAIGSFLLFFTNFVSIMLVSSILFHKAGMSRSSGTDTPHKIFRKFGLASIGFIVMLGILINSLSMMTRERMVHHQIKERLTVEFANYATTGIDKLLVNVRDGKVHALAQIYAPGTLSSDAVQRFEQQLEEKLEMPVSLVVREISSSDISSGGDNVAVVEHSLDGFFVDNAVRPEVRIVQSSVEIIKGYLHQHTGLHLLHADFFHLEKQPVVLAKISGVRRLGVDEIKMLESKIRKKADLPELRLILRFENIDLYTDDGLVLPYWDSITPFNEEQAAAMKKIRTELGDSFAQNEHYLLDSVHGTVAGNNYEILAAVSGAGAFDQKELQALESRLSSLAEKQVQLYVWLNKGAVMTAKGLISFAKLNETRKARLNEKDEQLLHKALRRVR